MRNLAGHPHRRYNPLAGRWVLVAAERTNRPWQGAEEPPPTVERSAYDPQCYLCPGNDRAGGRRNPDYEHTFVFPNDFPALRPDAPAEQSAPHPLLRSHTQPGTCRVLCFHPRHDLTLARMSTAQVRRVVDLWTEQVHELSPRFSWVQVFENHGAAMGASNPHPHGQVWASAIVPDDPAAEDRNQRDYRDQQGTSLLVDYAELESAGSPRMVLATEDWLVVVPFWAVWPFETLVVPRRPVARLFDLAHDERTSLADVLRRLLARYDNLFSSPFPYSMGWHGAPGVSGGEHHWQLHAHFYPPLLRSPTVRKFLVGYEMLGDVQRDISPEEAAGRLREQPEVHYSRRPR